MVSLKPERLKRYKDVALLFIKYGRSDLVQQAGLEDSIELDEMELAETRPQAEELAADLERLGPTFIKLGQLLSTRADLLPTPYLESLSRLQDRIEPFSYEEVDQIVSGELVSASPSVRRLRSRTAGCCVVGAGASCAHA